MRLYLDIDGVITGKLGSVSGLEQYVIDGCSVEWHPLLLPELLGKFDEVVWATSWILIPDALTELERRLEIGPFDRIGLTRENYDLTSDSCGKLDAVRAHYDADPAPFYWIDDHAAEEDIRWANSVDGNIIGPQYEQGGVYSVMLLTSWIDGTQWEL